MFNNITIEKYNYYMFIIILWFSEIMVIIELYMKRFTPIYQFIIKNVTNIMEYIQYEKIVQIDRNNDKFWLNITSFSLNTGIGKNAGGCMICEPIHTEGGECICTEDGATRSRSNSEYYHSFHSLWIQNDGSTFSSNGLDATHQTPQKSNDELIIIFNKYYNETVQHIGDKVFNDKVMITMKYYNIYISRLLINNTII